MNSVKGPSRMQLRYRALKRLILWHTQSDRIPVYLVAAYPKSGGTWYSQMLADCLDIPFHRNNEADKFELSVSHAHYLHHPRFKNTSVLLRDGRDVMVSAYYHFLFFNERKWKRVHEETRAAMSFTDYDNIKDNLPEFIEKYMYEVYPQINFARNTWTDFVDSWLDKGSPMVKYEDLLTRPVDALLEVTSELTQKDIPREKIEAVVEKFSFKRMSNKKKLVEGDKMRFERKGISGDWRNHFTEEACRVFDKYAGDTLIRAGYETSRDWIAIQAEHISQLEK